MKKKKGLLIAILVILANMPITHAQQRLVAEIPVSETCGRVWIDLDDLFKTKNQVVFTDYGKPSSAPVPLGILYDNVTIFDEEGGEEKSPLDTLRKLNNLFYTVADSDGSELMVQKASSGYIIKLHYISGTRILTASNSSLAPYTYYPLQMVDFHVIDASECEQVKDNYHY